MSMEGTATDMPQSSPSRRANSHGNSGRREDLTDRHCRAASSLCFLMPLCSGSKCTLLACRLSQIRSVFMISLFGVRIPIDMTGYSCAEVS